VSEVCVRADETDCDGHFDVYLFGGVDDTVCDGVAFHDAAEDVDEDAFDFGVA